MKLNFAKVFISNICLKNVLKPSMLDCNKPNKPETFDPNLFWTAPKNNLSKSIVGSKSSRSRINKLNEFITNISLMC